MRYRIFYVMAFVCGLMSVQRIQAQNNVAISPLDEEFFKSLLPKKDSTKKVNLFRDKFSKRLAFHFNMVDWALTMPSVGFEMDLKQTKKNNRSLLLFAKYNGNTSHTVVPKFVFNVGAIRLEFRKYWRTGRLGMNDFYHEEYRTMNLYRPDTLWRKVPRINEFGDEVLEKEYYFDRHDSAWIAAGNEYEGDPNRGRFSNGFENARRIVSTRTMKTSRNWRAYYIGAFAGWDKFSLCVGKKGEQGTLLSVGGTFGYSIPLLTRRYPKEGGLDLDLGVNVGLPVAKYDGYKYIYQENNSFYTQRGHSKDDGWGIAPKYALRDVHVTLVYRLRSVSRKVSLALVDDYLKHIQDWENRQRRITEEKRMIEEISSHRLDSLGKVEAHNTDSASWADWQRRDYLKALKELYPDMELHGQDSLDYIRLVLGKNFEDYKREKARTDRLQKQLEQIHQDSLNYIQRIFAQDSTDKAKIEERKQKRIERDSIARRNAFVKDSIAHVRDSVDKVRKDSIQVVKDSIQAIKDAERAERQAVKDAERAAEQARKDAEREAERIRKEVEQAAKDAERAEREAEEAARRKEEEEIKQKERIEREVNKKLEEHQREIERQQRQVEEEARRKAREADREAERQAREIQLEAERRARAAEKELQKAENEARKQREAEEAEVKAAEKEQKKAEDEIRKAADKEKKAAEKAEKEVEKEQKKALETAKKAAEKATKEAAKAAKKELEEEEDNSENTETPATPDTPEVAQSNPDTSGDPADNPAGAAGDEEETAAVPGQPVEIESESEHKE